MGFSEVFSNCLCLAQLGKLSVFRTSLEHVVLCCWCWRSISVTWSWASRIWMGLGMCGNALSELRTLFRGFHALAEVEKVRLENKECNFLHWFFECVCVCFKSNASHISNCWIQKNHTYKILPLFSCAVLEFRSFSLKMLYVHMCRFTLRKAMKVFNQHGQLCGGTREMMLDWKYEGILCILEV